MDNLKESALNDLLISCGLYVYIYILIYSVLKHV